MNRTLKVTLLAILFISSSFAQETEQIEAQEAEQLEAQETEVYESPFKEDPNMLFGDFNERNIDLEEGGRMLGSYPRLRITNDYTYLTQSSDAFLNYVKNELIPAVTDYLEAAVGNKYPLGSPISVSTPTLCGRDTPQALLTGVDTDLYVIYNSESSSGSWIAAATSCMVSTGMKRPIIITIGLNVPKVKIPDANDSPLTHDLNINVLTHEYIHGLALNGVYFNYFVDSNGRLLSNHVKSITLSGTRRTVLDLPSLTSRIRSYIGCNSVPGYILRKDGTAHPDARFYQWDIMATGGVTGSKITQFTLGFLEGTGWYAPDYDYAEPYFFGQGEGCTFYADSVAASTMEEYCAGAEVGCTATGDSGGYCVGLDTTGYRVITAQPLLNCENPVGVNYSPLSKNQVYGRGKGSKCFTGNLSTGKAASQTGYCLQYTCSGSGSSTQLQLSFGAATITCNQKGPISVAGYSGTINCPDPLTYCRTVGAPSCPKNCMGRGRCSSGRCNCYSGFKGTDCGFNS